MIHLHLDIESFGEVDLKTEGLYKYSESCEILMVAYDHSVRGKGHIDLTETFDLPDWLKSDLVDPNVIKFAHNAPFEIECFMRYFKIPLIRSQWICTLVRAAIAGLPLGLDQVGKALKLDTVKSPEGKALIKYWCTPCKPTKANGFRTRNMPWHAPEKWAAFCRYNIQDVDAEVEVYKASCWVPTTKFEYRLWVLDQEINARGMRIDQQLCRNAIQMNTVFRNRLVKEAIEITGLENPNSRNQVKAWLEEEVEELIPDLKKASIQGLLDKFTSEKAKRVLEIRQMLSKSSVNKYVNMMRSLSSTGRLCGLFQFYGANRTGRWAGRQTQPHNLPKNKYKGQILQLARDLALAHDSYELEWWFGAIPDTLSQLLRTAFVPAPGKRFIVSDYKAIEARVIAWLAGEKWRLDVFAQDGDIYATSAAKMFNVPVELCGKGTNFRDKGKIAELALGFGGGVNALIKMGSAAMGLLDSELQALVDLWRLANIKIKKLWYDVDGAAKRCIRTGQKVTIQKGISFEYRNKYLLITLPSGRVLSYVNASLEPGKFGKFGDEIRYWGLHQESKTWVKLKTYGGKLVENIVQAIARDCLAQGLMNLNDAGYTIVAHIHDEVICEETLGQGSHEEVNALLVKPAPWMREIPLAAEGYEGFYYKKED